VNKLERIYRIGFKIEEIRKREVTDVWNFED
jgi:hypothetical protein